MSKQIMVGWMLLMSTKWIDGYQDGPIQSHVDKSFLVEQCVQLAASCVQRGIDFFSREPIAYNLQEDVLQVPFKAMLYTTTQTIEQLFDDANKHDNPKAQIKALIMLCRSAVPASYFKQFYKGMDQMFALCFDDQGNFKDAQKIVDIRLIFKDYCKKSPSCWQDIAKIAAWRFRRKKSYALYTKYYAASCTEYNEDLLAMIHADPIKDKSFLDKLATMYATAAVYKIYQAHMIHAGKLYQDQSNIL